MAMDGAESKVSEIKLTGWKMIGRHLGRSPRAVQFWEEQRGLPIHRIPGGRGQTVFAYAAELDAWMHGRELPLIGLVGRDAATAVASPVVATVTTPSTRAPGILVLPCEGEFGQIGDVLCRQLIVRLSAVQPLRVLSWTTSRSERQNVDAIESTARRLNVRYVVETAIERGRDALHVDVRIIDAEIDHIVLADRFLLASDTSSTAHAELAEGVALHFALLHAGALVEPLCLADMPPALFLDYLAAVRWFFEDGDGATGRALELLDRLLGTAPGFDLARALRGLVLLRMMPAEREADVVNEARGIVDALMYQTEARVTTAFLAAAIDRLARRGGAPDPLSKAAMRWMPSSVVRDGRLYDRRSTRPPAADATGGRRGADERRTPLTTERPRGPLDDLLQELQLAQRCRDRMADAQTRVIHVRFPRAVAATGEPGRTEFARPASGNMPSPED